MKLGFRLAGVGAIALGALAGVLMGAEPSLQGGSGGMSAADLAVLPAHIEPASSAKTSAIPEPVSLAVFGIGLVFLLRRRRS